MRVALLGMGPSADAYARYCAFQGDRDKAFDEVWTVNAFGSVFKTDRVFHMDDIRIQQIRADAGNQQITNLLDYLQRAEGPIYTSRPLPKGQNPLYEFVQEELGKLEGDGKIVNAETGMTERQYLDGVMRWLKAERTLQERGGFEGLVTFPLADVINGAGGPPFYFSSTVPYAIAMALAGVQAGLPEDVDTLAMFGIDYSHANVVKAEVGRACCEFWLGRCVEKGMAIHLPPETWLLGADGKNRLYGYDTQRVSFTPDGQITFKECPAPTAEQIEAAYAH